GGGSVGFGVRVEGSFKGSRAGAPGAKSRGKANEGSSMPGSGAPGVMRGLSSAQAPTQSCGWLLWPLATADRVEAAAAAHASCGWHARTCMQQALAPQQVPPERVGADRAEPLLRRSGAWAATMIVARSIARVERIVPSSYTIGTGFESISGFVGGAHGGRIDSKRCRGRRGSHGEGYRPCLGSRGSQDERDRAERRGDPVGARGPRQD